jgi:hypothetical protein
MIPPNSTLVIEVLALEVKVAGAADPEARSGS